ncbi:MAG: hypothetical protein WC788_07730 [Candidatus Paceibacterota bacterium]|jgi:hypothetical protein
MKSKKLASYFLLAVFFVFSLAALAIAADERGYLAKDRVIDDDFIAASESVDVGGTVNGDVILAGGVVDFSGRSSGDILAAGGNLRVSGQNDGNIRAAGGNVFIEGNVGKNVTAAGGNLSLGENSNVSGNVYLAGGMVEIRGNIGKNLKVAGGSVILKGVVKGNAEIMAEDITARPGAKIEGNLTYYSDGSKNLNIDNNLVAGEIIRKNIPVKNYRNGSSGAFLASGIIGFFGFLLLAYVFYKLFPRGAREIFGSLVEKGSWKMIAAGILALILIPVSIVVLMITIIGMPLAMVLVFVFISAILLAKATAAIVLGFAINKRLRPREFSDSFPLMDFILGYLILEVLMLIPFLGPLFAFLIFLWAFGGLVKYAYDGFQKKQAKL